MNESTKDLEAVERLGQTRDAIVQELRKTIVGMDDVIDQRNLKDSHDSCA